MCLISLFLSLKDTFDNIFFIHNNPKLETTQVSSNEWQTWGTAVEWDTNQQKEEITIPELI